MIAVVPVAPFQRSSNNVLHSILLANMRAPRKKSETHRSASLNRSNIHILVIKRSKNDATINVPMVRHQQQQHQRININ